MEGLAGKNAFVTGTNRGLGKAIVEKLCQSGCNVWSHARKYNESFEEHCKTLSNKYGVSVSPVYFDMCDYDHMKSEIMKIMKSRGRIDILVNNAGIVHGGLIQTTPISTVKDVFDTNLFSTFQLSQLVVKLMIKDNLGGSIVNVASIAGLDMDVGNCAYGLSKAALISLTTLMSKEYGPYGIRVNAVAPDLLDTDMGKIIESKAGLEMVSKSLTKRLGKSEEVANVIAFLASDMASWVSGQTIRVDGGRE